MRSVQDALGTGPETMVIELILSQLQTLALHGDSMDIHSGQGALLTSVTTQLVGHA